MFHTSNKTVDHIALKDCKIKYYQALLFQFEADDLTNSWLFDMFVVVVVVVVIIVVVVAPEHEPIRNKLRIMQINLPWKSIEWAATSKLCQQSMILIEYGTVSENHNKIY